MHFLCACYYDLDAFNRLQPQGLQKLVEIAGPHDARLKASGKVSLIGSLGVPNEFRTLRALKNGAVSDEPGPYEQTKEPFGAFFIVEAENMDEAVRIARLHPSTHLGEMLAGGIEIRPIEMLDRVTS